MPQVSMSMIPWNCSGETPQRLGVYVSRSSTVRATFVHEPRAMGPMGRLLIALLALVLIVWPFVPNVFSEATVELAARISPKDTSAGTGFSHGILAMSVATGLFILMKNAVHMRNAWIAVLLPVCFAVLFLLYGMQGFALHYGS